MCRSDQKIPISTSEGFLFFGMHKNIIHNKSYRSEQQQNEPRDRIFFLIQRVDDDACTTAAKATQI